MTACPIRSLTDLDADGRAALRVRGVDGGEPPTSAAAAVVDDVRRRGDRAVCEFLARVDGVALDPSRFVMTGAEAAQLAASVAPSLRAALERSARNLAVFCDAQMPRAWEREVEPGVRIGERFPAVAAAGLYAPFGKAIYPSTAVMITVPPRIAGVERIVMSSGVDPTTGELPAAVAAAALIGGATEIWRLSGTVAMAAFAYGTETLRPVDVVAGPGGPFVAAAKRLIANRVGTDLEAGPSEVLVLGLAGDPDVIAADLIAEGEHGADSTALIVTADASLAAAAAAAVDDKVSRLPTHRRAALEAQFARGASGVIVVADAAAAAALADELAFEHVVIHAADARAVADRLRFAGTVCIGSPSAVASYLAGTNHVLPTGGAARHASGLSVDHFLRRQSFSEISDAAIGSLRADVAALADFEGFPGHLAAADVRLRGAGDEPGGG